MKQFFDNFGTHMIQQVDMGAKYIAKSEFSRATQSLMKSKGRTVKFSAEGSGPSFSASGSASASDS